MNLSRSTVLSSIAAIAILGAAAASVPTVAMAGDDAGKSSAVPTFADALNATAGSAVQETRLTPVREAALRETAMTLGLQWGIGDRSRAIVDEYKRLSNRLDAKYQFNALMMGVGILPPVISEARNAVSIEDTVLRVANRVWSIDEPARPVINPPTWRDWLFVGLQPDLRPAAPSNASVLPRDDAEKAYYKSQMMKGYEEGTRQVTSIFELNLARLDRSYAGMTRFYDLWKQGRVTAPVIASATTIIDHDDPNTVVVGNTVFRITVPTKFVTDTDKWKPLDR